jgi:2-aminoethylphosphonate-pyruvate transaminase
MKNLINPNSKSDKLLFTPGPLTTSFTVKEASLRDLGSRDTEFISVVRSIRERLLEIANVNKTDYQTVIMQGSGTFGVESVISSVIPADGLLLNITNGAYGARITKMAEVHSISYDELIYEENSLPDLKEIEEVLNDNHYISHISVVHGETTTGLINPIAEIGRIAKKHNIPLIVDAMSTYGAYPIDMKEMNISFLVSSSNKCIEGIPGFSFVIALRSELEKCENQARSLSLDLYDQWKGLESNGQFRFTPPVQAIMAFNQALNELEAEGGVMGRAERYCENNSILIEGMTNLGFDIYLPEEIRGYIITSFLYPENPKFSFEVFYTELSNRGYVIYPGKLSKKNCFRIGNIGRLQPEDIMNLLTTIAYVMRSMEIV